jgi:hypothetical protein
VPLTNIVVLAVPFQAMTVLGMNPVPMILSTAPASLVVIVEGEAPVITGLGLLMANVAALEVPPPGPGLVTVTCAVPADARSACVMVAVNCVLLTNVVARSEPFHFTEDALMNPEPLSVKVAAALPVIALVGANVPIFGAGFDTGEGLVGVLGTLGVLGLFAPPPQAVEKTTRVEHNRAAEKRRPTLNKPGTLRS